MLFLADVDHANCAKIKLTRRHPPTGRRAGRFLGSSKVPDRQKETAALKIKAAVSKWHVKLSAVRRLFFFCRRAADCITLSNFAPLISRKSLEFPQ